MRTYSLYWFATQQQVRTFRKQKCSEEFNELSFNLALTLSLPAKTWENLPVFLCFQGVEKGCIVNNLINF